MSKNYKRQLRELRRQQKQQEQQLQMLQLQLRLEHQAPSALPSSPSFDLRDMMSLGLAGSMVRSMWQ